MAKTPPPPTLVSFPTSPKQKRRRSALESFDGCPDRYNRLYNLGVEDRGDESQRGIGFHEAAFRYIEQLARHKIESDRTLAVRAFQEGVAITQLPVHLLDETWRIWQRFSEWFQLDLRAYLTAEERQESDRFTWIPDLVYVRPKGIEIKDWKTYYKGLTRKQALKEFQLKFYLVQALEIWPNFPTYTFTFNFVRLGYEVPITLTPDVIEKFRPEVEAILLQLEASERSGQWPAIPGSHCTLCRLNCPVVDNPHRTKIRITTQAEFDQVAGEILVLEQRLKVLKKAAAGWCSQEGAQVLNGQEFAHRSSESTHYPAGPVVDALRKHYLNTITDPANLLSVSASAIKAADPMKLVQNDPDIQALGYTEKKWQFRHKKAGELQDHDDDDEV